MTKRVTVVLEDDIASQLETLAGSQRRQSQYITDLVRAAWKNQQHGALPEIEQLRLQTIGLSVELNQIKSRLLRIEQQCQTLDEFS